MAVQASRMPDRKRARSEQELESQATNRGVGMPITSCRSLVLAAWSPSCWKRSVSTGRLDTETEPQVIWRDQMRAPVVIAERGCVVRQRGRGGSRNTPGPVNKSGWAVRASQPSRIQAWECCSALALVFVAAVTCAPPRTGAPQLIRTRTYLHQMLSLGPIPDTVCTWYRLDDEYHCQSPGLCLGALRGGS